MMPTLHWQTINFHSKPEWFSRDIEELVGLRERAIRYHLNRLNARDLQEPFPRGFPLSSQQARRFMAYLDKRPKGRGRKRKK
jgi:hypothetical protein